MAPPFIIIESDDEAETKEVVPPNPGSSRSSTMAPDEAKNSPDGGAHDDDPVVFDAGAIRLRGRALGLAGHLYPVARFTLHKIGAPADSDIKVPSDLLRHGAYARSLAAPAAGAGDDYYRVHLDAVDTSEEGRIGWASHHHHHHHHHRRLSPAAQPPLEADDYVGLCRLGDGAAVAKWMLFVRHTNDDGEGNAWAVASQVKGKAYSLEDCLEILDVPARARRRVVEGGGGGFGPRAWVVGRPVPEYYLAKDLPLRYVETKIREVMRLRA